MFNWEKFAQDVRVKIAKDNLQNKAVCQELGILPSTLSRLLAKGNKCNIDTIVKLCRWLKTSMDYYAK